jgi:hypothetical protein
MAPYSSFGSFPVSIKSLDALWPAGLPTAPCNKLKKNTQSRVPSRIGTHKSGAPGRREGWIFLRLLLIQYLWVRSRERAACHVSGECNFEVYLRFLENFVDTSSNPMPWKNVCLFVGHGKWCIFNTEYGTDFRNKESQNPIQIRTVVNKLLDNKERKKTRTLECVTARAITSLQTHKNCWRNSVPCHTHCSNGGGVLCENNSVC